MIGLSRHVLGSTGLKIQCAYVITAGQQQVTQFIGSQIQTKASVTLEVIVQCYLLAPAAFGKNTCKIGHGCGQFVELALIVCQQGNPDNGCRLKYCAYAHLRAAFLKSDHGIAAIIIRHNRRKNYNIGCNSTNLTPLPSKLCSL